MLFLKKTGIEKIKAKLLSADFKEDEAERRLGNVILFVILKG